MFLRIKNLRVGYGSGGREVEVVRGVDLEIKKGECLGLVGESGCGKTTVGLSITRLIPAHKGRILSGEIIFEDRDILKMDDGALRRLRGDRISYVFQEPFSSLNPVFTIYSQIAECAKGAKNTDDKIAEALKSVGLEKIIGKKNLYPHELSGGMQQRAMIAMAIISRPDLLVLDEPTTALDVTIQAQILELIMDLKEKLGLSILFISHDLRTVFKISDRIAVMYAGVIAEEGQSRDIMSRPRHPYTSGLLASIPSFEHRKQFFNAIEGKAPLFTDLSPGCKFYPRCGYRIDACAKEEPAGCIRQGELKLDGIIKNK
ncbi:MAG: ABC transporter ATP-binding protein [Candidatus Omnitrophota bacterium]